MWDVVFPGSIRESVEGSHFDRDGGIKEICLRFNSFANRHTGWGAIERSAPC
jgi:hypothetical protein